jgi:hypothetical protein
MNMGSQRKNIRKKPFRSSLKNDFLPCFCFGAAYTEGAPQTFTAIDGDSRFVSGLAQRRGS